VTVEHFLLDGAGPKDVDISNDKNSINTASGIPNRPTLLKHKYSLGNTK